MRARTLSPSIDIPAPSDRTGDVVARKETLALPILDDQQYLCPGETHPISRSVHLARLSAFADICRECPHRHETHNLAGSVRQRLTHREQTHVPGFKQTAQGFRAEFLNQLDRDRAIIWGESLGIWLLKDRVWQGDLRSPFERESVNDTRYELNPGPAVVIAFDQRPSSPEIVTGIGLGLRRAGCHVIDLGQTTKPCWNYAVAHRQATLGVYVTGAGENPGWTGFDCALSGGIPWCRESELSAIEFLTQSPRTRPSRSSGGLSLFTAQPAYEAELLNHFHAIRPLNVVIGCDNPLLSQSLQRLFSRLPCRLTTISIPNRLDAEQERWQRVRDAIVEKSAHLGGIIDDSGETFTLMDERGTVVSTDAMLRLILRHALREHPSATIVVQDHPTTAMMSHWLTQQGSRVISGGSTAQTVAEQLHRESGITGILADGGLLHHPSHPTRDAIITLAKTIQALSVSDEDVSVRAERG